MLKKFSVVFVISMFATIAVAQSGLSCNDPIPVDESYEGIVDGPCTLWYTANTFDLPLKVHFTPHGADSQQSPEVEVDLTCTPGVYDDPKIDSLINLVSEFDLSFPIELRCNMVTSSGKVEWDLAINDTYREQLAEFGITYNVPAYVKVKFYEGGNISLSPDTTFQICMANSQYVNLGDTLDILPNDSNTSFIFPYTDWQKDSIRFVWIGDQEARVWLGTMDCSYVPDVDNGFVWGYYDVTEDNPKKLYTSQMKDAIKDSQHGGLFYGKVTAPVSGKLVVEKIPIGEAQGGAILLEYGKSVQLTANDTNRLFCFPRTWEATKFVASTNFILNMYASPSAEFGVASANGVTRRTYTYDMEDGHRVLYMSNVEMEKVTTLSTDDYIYVRFASNAPTTITPEQWDASDCAGESTLIRPNDSFTVLARSSKTIFRMRYDDWVGYDITIQWSTKVPMPVYIGDICSFPLSSTNSHVLQYAYIRPGGTYSISKDAIASWASRVDADGYLYVHFNPSAQGTVTFKTDKPADVDPEIPTSPCVASSIELKKGDQLTLNLDSAFTVYRIKYDEWITTDASLAWTGAEPLHTFVAETCTFAVAPYNKYVHAYVPVPASGNIVLDTTTLTNMAEYVDEDGYLYIRFLTEFEGELTVK